MMEFKLRIVKQLERNAQTVNAVLLRKAAIECGHTHIKTQDCRDIINAFLKRNPTYRVYQLADKNSRDSLVARGSLFVTAFFTECECLPYPDCEWVNEYYSDRKNLQY